MVKPEPVIFAVNPFRPGKGTMYVKNDGVVFNFCTRRCPFNETQVP